MAKSVNLLTQNTNLGPEKVDLNTQFYIVAKNMLIRVNKIVNCGQKC